MPLQLLLRKIQKLLEGNMRSLFAFRTDRPLRQSAGAWVLAAVMMVVTTACNQATILAYLQQLAPTAIAVLNLAAAFGAKGVTPQQTENINTTSANVIDLYKKWQAASAAAKPDALAQFNSAYSTFAANIEETLMTLRVVDPKKQNEVAAAVAAGLILLNQIQVLIPGNTPTAGQRKGAAEGQFFKSPKDFQKHFNKIMVGSGHAELAIK
jgi:hypothetical protein